MNLFKQAYPNINNYVERLGIINDDIFTVASKVSNHVNFNLPTKLDDMHIYLIQLENHIKKL